MHLKKRQDRSGLYLRLKKHEAANRPDSDIPFGEADGDIRRRDLRGDSRLTLSL